MCSLIRKEGIQRVPTLSHTVHPMDPWERSPFREETKTPYICFPVAQNRTDETPQLSSCSIRCLENNKIERNKSVKEKLQFQG